MFATYLTDLEDSPMLAVSRVECGHIVVTAHDFTDFIYQWARIDPNGTWNPAGVREENNTLSYMDENGEYTWPVNEDGTYTLTYWPYKLIDETRQLGNPYSHETAAQRATRIAETTNAVIGSVSESPHSYIPETGSNYLSEKGYEH